MEILILAGIISDRGSKYAVSGGVAVDRAAAKAFIKALKKNKKFAKATHNSWALVLPCGEIVKNDDGESGAGMLIGRILVGADVFGVIVVVTRWYGGTHLGGDRFRHVKAATQQFLHHWAENC